MYFHSFILAEVIYVVVIQNNTIDIEKKSTLHTTLHSRTAATLCVVIFNYKFANNSVEKWMETLMETQRRSLIHSNS